MSEQLFVRDWYGRNLPMTCDLRQLRFGQFHFITLMAARMNERRGNKGRTRDLVKEARTNFFDFLAQSRVKFGDPEYPWTPQAAFEVADEYAAYDDKDAGK